MRWLKEIWNWLTGPDLGRSSAEAVSSIVDNARPECRLARRFPSG